MSESDKIELENKRLKEKNESLKREKYQAEQEAKMRVRNFKAQYDADYREMNEQKERLANRKKELDEKEADIEKICTPHCKFVHHSHCKFVHLDTVNLYTTIYKLLLNSYFL